MGVMEALSVGVAAGLGWGVLIGAIGALAVVHRLLGEDDHG